MNDVPFPSPYPNVYDPWDSAHQDWLMWFLEAYEVPVSFWDEIGFAMEGRTVTELDSVVKACRRGEL